MPTLSRRHYSSRKSCMTVATDQTIVLRLLLIRDLAKNYASVCKDLQMQEGFDQLSRMADDAQRLLPHGVISEGIPPLRSKH